MEQPSKTVLLSIGSNSCPELNMARGKERLSEIFDDIVFTKEIWTKAVGAKAPDYMNCLGKAVTNRTIEEVNQLLKAIEQDMGRVHHHPKGLVTIDIDILKFGEDVFHASDWSRSYVQLLLDEPFAPLSNIR